MRTIVVAVLVLSVAVAPACTIIGIGAGAATAGIHNWAASERNAWDYTPPVLVGATLGLITDIVLFTILKRQWSKPMS